MESSPGVPVQVVTTQISPRSVRDINPLKTGLADLASREQDIRDAVDAASKVVAAAAMEAGKVNAGGWGVDEIEATFGLTFGIEAGVLISKASAEATLEVRVLVRRQPA